MAHRRSLPARLLALLLAAALLGGTAALAAEPQAAPAAAIYTTSDMLGKLYDEDPLTQLAQPAHYGKVASAQVVGTNGQGHGALAGVLKALGVDVLICGGIGGGARAALDAQGIRLYGGVTGEADRAVEALLAGKLDYDPQAHCDHHGQEHGGSHACAHHEGHGHGPCGQGCHG